MIFLFTLAVKVAIIHFAEVRRLLFARLNKKVDAHALLNVKHILVGRTVGARFFFLVVAVQVKRVNSVEGGKQAPPHATKRGVVEKTVRIYIAHHSTFVAFDIVLRQTYKLHIVVVYPFRVAFLQCCLSARLFLVVVHQPHYPLATVLAFARVRRIAYHHHHRAVALNAVCGPSLVAEPLRPQCARVGMTFLERVGEIYFQASFVFGMVETSLLKQHVELKVSHRIACHKEFETVQSRKQMLVYISLPHALHAAKPAVYEAHHLGKEGACAGGRVENLHPVHLLLYGGRCLPPRLAATICLLVHHVVHDFRVVGQPIGKPEVAL